MHSAISRTIDPRAEGCIVKNTLKINVLPPNLRTINLVKKKKRAITRQKIYPVQSKMGSLGVRDCPFLVQYSQSFGATEFCSAPVSFSQDNFAFW